MDPSSVRDWTEVVDECSSMGEWCFSFDRNTLFADLLRNSKELYDHALTDLRSAADLNPWDVRLSLFAVKALRKWRLAVDAIDARSRADEAYQSFIQRNEAAQAVGQCRVPADVQYIMRGLLTSWLPYPDGVLAYGKFGPGACYERWDHSKRAAKLAEWINASEHWPECPVGHADFSKSTARLCAVPKDWYRDRLITVEPAYNTFSQAYVRELLRISIHQGPLRGTVMDLGFVDGQAVQRRLALKASRTGELATLDLRDASDGIRVEDVLAVFPSWVCDLLMVTRSEKVSHRGSTYPLAIFAGMGNGTTFTVETLFFTALCCAYARRYAIPASIRGRNRVSVFGDDIVCPSALAAKLVQETASLPCFQINMLKSFWGDSKFREACGIFAYRGEDVTSPRIDGISDDWDGDCALSDLHFRSTVQGRGAFLLLAHRIASMHRLANWPFYVDGFPSICDWSIDFDRLPTTRFNRDYWRREARVLCDEAIGRYHPLQDGPGRRISATVWLNLALSGQLVTRMFHHAPAAYIVERDARRCSRWRWRAISATRSVVNSTAAEVNPQPEGPLTSNCESI